MTFGKVNYSAFYDNQGDIEPHSKMVELPTTTSATTTSTWSYDWRRVSKLASIISAKYSIMNPYQTWQNRRRIYLKIIFRKCLHYIRIQRNLLKFRVLWLKKVKKLNCKSRITIFPSIPIFGTSSKRVFVIA